MDLTSKGQGPGINLTLTGVATKRAILYRHLWMSDTLLGFCAELSQKSSLTPLEGS